MRHGVRMGNGTPRAGKEGLQEPREQGAATLLLLTGPVQGTSCPFCPTGLGSLMEPSPGVREEHTFGSWYILPTLHRGGGCAHHGDGARSHMPAVPSPLLGWQASTDGLCLPSCSPTPSTLLGQAGITCWGCSAFAAPASRCSLPASLAGALCCPSSQPLLQSPQGWDSWGTATPTQRGCPAGVDMLPRTHLTPAHVRSSPRLAHRRGLQGRLMGTSGHPHLQLWPAAWLRVASLPYRKPLPSRRMSIWQNL